MPSNVVINTKAIDSFKKELADKLELVGEVVRSSIVNEIDEQGLIDTGRYKNSIDYSVDKQDLSVKIGTNVEYACILGSNAVITTDKGVKTIGQVKVGDYVLTQTGDYKKVNYKYVMPIKEGTNLVDIEVEYRNGNTHKLTVTDEHKILVFHENRNKWIKAGDLELTDMIYTRNKKAINKGTGKIKICLNCGNEYSLNTNKKYCSLKCRDEHYNKGNNPHLGMKRSDSTRKLQSEIAKKRPKEQHPNYRVGKLEYTQPELDIKEWLDSRTDIEYEHNKYINGYFVDFFVSSSIGYQIYETDGAYWHKDQNKDIERDKKILESELNIKSITHIHYYDKRHSPENIKMNPIDNVYYLMVNPSMNSFVNLDEYKQAKIVSLNKWEYKNPDNKQARKQNLYDLSVEDIHSYYANGILVSNSFLEFGTIKMQPRPAIRIGFWTSENKIKEILSK